MRVAPRPPDPRPEPPVERAVEARIEPPAVAAPAAPKLVPAPEVTAPELALKMPQVAPPPPARETTKEVPREASVGELLTPAMVNAAYLKNPKPEYPSSSLRRREEGTVLLRVRVAPDGRPLLVTIDRSSGFPALDRSAREVVANAFRFVPARRGNQSVEGEVRVPIEFVLPKD